MEWVVKYVWERETKDDFRDLVPCAWKGGLGKMEDLEMGEGGGQQTLKWRCSWMEGPGWSLGALVPDFPWAFVHSHVLHHVNHTCVSLQVVGPSCKISHVLSPQEGGVLMGPGVLIGRLSLSQVCISLWGSWDSRGGPLQSRLRFAAVECSRGITRLCW